MRIEVETSSKKRDFSRKKLPKLLDSTKRAVKLLSCLFNFNQTQISRQFPHPHTQPASIVHNFSQSRKTFSMRCERDGNSRGWDELLLPTRLTPTIPLMYARTCGIIKHIEQKINFIFFSIFFWDRKDFRRGIKNEKIIANVE